MTEATSPAEVVERLEEWARVPYQLRWMTADDLRAAASLIRELTEALKPFADIEECNGLKYGICQTRRCLVEGGWQKGNPDYSVATCKHRRAAKLVEPQ